MVRGQTHLQLIAGVWFRHGHRQQREHTAGAQQLCTARAHRVR